MVHLWNFEELPHLTVYHFRLQKCFSFAALACVLRPTNIIIWATLSVMAFLRPVRPTQVRNRILRGTPEERGLFCRKLLCVGYVHFSCCSSEEDSLHVQMLTLL